MNYFSTYQPSSTVFHFEFFGKSTTKIKKCFGLVNKKCSLINM